MSMSRQVIEPKNHFYMNKSNLQKEVK